MPGLMESIDTINNAVRTVLALVVLGAVGIGGYVGYNRYYANEIEVQNKKKELTVVQQQLAETEAHLDASRKELESQRVEIDRLNVDVREKQQRIDKLAASNRLLKMQRRVASLRVVAMENDPATGELFTTIEFIETNDQGQPVDQPKRFRLKGDMVFIDGWIVKFEDAYVEQADLERGMSICLFRRLFGEKQQPSEGFSLLAEGVEPGAYSRGEPVSEFERRIWQDFWTIANDPSREKELGIRAAHGQAVSMRVQRNKAYRLELRTSGEITIVPDDKAPPAGRPST